MQKEKTLSRFFIFLLFYSFLHGLLLLNRGYFWDDWAWTAFPIQYWIAINEIGKVFFKVYFYELMKSPHSVILIKSIVFFSFFFGSWLFFKAISKLDIIRGPDRWLMGLLLISFPFDIIGRSTMSNFPYSISFFAFALGYYFYVKFRKSNHTAFFFLSLLSITLSFDTGSFLVLWVVAVLLTELALQKPIVSYRRAVFGGSLAFLHALAFFIFKRIFFKSYGRHAHYNNVHISIPVLLEFSFKTGPQSFLQPIIYSIAGKSVTLALDRLFPIYTLLFYAPLILAFGRKTQKKHRMLMLAGTLFALGAVFPYIAVGKMPDTFSWESRHQLALPFGALIWFIAVLSFIPKPKWRQAITAALVVLFSLGTARLYLLVQTLNYEQVALMSGFKAVVEPLQPGSYIFVGLRERTGLTGNNWNTYFMNAMVHIELKGHDHAVISEPPDMPVFQSEVEYKKVYPLTNTVWEPPFYCVYVTSSDRLDAFSTLRLLSEEWLGQSARFQSGISSIYRFKKQTAAMSASGGPACSQGPK